MLTDEQLAKRRTGITATDISALVGMNPWKSELEVYADKCGTMPTKPQTEPMWWGNALEGALWMRYALSIAPAYTVTEWGQTATGAESWMLATPDASVRFAAPTRTLDTQWGVELKTAWSFGHKADWEGTQIPFPPPDPDEAYYATCAKIVKKNGDRVPIQYMIQCQWSMAVTGLDRWDLAVLLAIGNGPEFRVYTLKRDQALIDMLVEGSAFCKECKGGVICAADHCPQCGAWSWMGARAWWETYVVPVQAGERAAHVRLPDPDGSRSAGWALASLAQPPCDELGLADEGIEQDVEVYIASDIEVKRWETQRDRVKQRLQKACVQAGVPGFRGEFGSFKSKPTAKGALGWYPQGLKEA